MKILNIAVSCVALASVVVLSGCQTPAQAEEAKTKSDAAIAGAKAETAVAQAETAAVQEKLDAEVAENKSQAMAAKEIPGSTLTEDGTLLFTAEGQSVAVAEDGAMGLAKARMAAEAIAKANLLEKIKGGLISSSVTVGDMMFQSQTVSTKVNGWLGGAVLKTETTSDEESNLPDAEPVDQIVTAQASLEISLSAWNDLQEYVE
jgi:hypothetical protein